MSTITTNPGTVLGTVRTKLSAFITPQSMLKSSGSTISATATAFGLYGAVVDGQTSHWSGDTFSQFDDHNVPTNGTGYNYGPAAFAGNNTPWFDATNANINAVLDRWLGIQNAGGGNRGTLVVYGDPGWSHPVETVGTTASGATTINVVSTQKSGGTAVLINNSGSLTTAGGMTISYTGTGATSLTGVTGVTSSLPAGTKLWQPVTNAATRAWAIAAPSFMDQRVADLIHFLEQLKIFHSGVLPVKALGFRQEHKGRIANGLGTGRAWESLDRSPDTWTPSDDNGHLSFFPWAHCLYWNKMFDAIRAHPDPDINTLWMIGPYYAFGGDNATSNGTLGENHHSFPLGDPNAVSGSVVAEWDWDTQPVRYFLKYGRHDNRTSFGADFSNRDNNYTVGLGPDDTYTVSRNFHKQLLTQRIRQFMAEFGWGDGTPGSSLVEYFESYYWVNIGSAPTTYPERQQAAFELMDHINHFVTFVDWIHEWQKDGDASGTNNLNLCSWVRQSFSSTATSNGTDGNVTNTGPGTKYLAYDYVKDLRTRFPIGTQLISATSDDTRLIPIASATTLLVLNTASTSITFTYRGANTTIPAYQYVIIAQHVVGLNDQAASIQDDLQRSGGVSTRALSDQAARITEALGVSMRPSFPALPRPRPAMRMTAKRYTQDQAGWAGGRTVVTTRAALVSALSAGTPATIADGAALGGGDVLLGNNADVRGQSYLGATLNLNLILDDTTNAVVQGLRFGAGFGVVGARAKNALVEWCAIDSNSLSDYGIRLVDPKGCVLRGNYTRRQRIAGQSLALSGAGLPAGFSPCVVEHARWDTCGSYGLDVRVPTLLSGVEGQGSGVAEVFYLANDSVVEDVRLGACVIGLLVGGQRLIVRRLQARPTTAAVQSQDTLLADSLVQHVFSTAGQYGINFLHPSNVTLTEVDLQQQTGASLRQQGGSLVFDQATMRLAPAAGGTPYLFVP